MEKEGKEKKRLIIIDSNSVIHRAFHALPPLSKKGELVNAVYGFLLVFLRALKDFNPNFIVAAFDFPAPSFRKKIFKLYKANREKAPDELYSQIPKVKDALTAFGVKFFEKEGYEADDIIGTVAKESPKKQIFPELETIIITGDCDALQLVDNHTKVYILRKGVKDVVLFDAEKVKEKYEGLSPEELLFYKSLRGDPSDNIPGVFGVGEKTAISLVKQFKTIDNLYQELAVGGEEANKLSPALRKKLLDYKDQAYVSQDLARINIKVPIDFDLKECGVDNYNFEKAVAFLEGYGFRSLAKRLSPSFDTSVAPMPPAPKEKKKKDDGKTAFQEKNKTQVKDKNLTLF